MGKLILYLIVFLFSIGSIFGLFGQELEISGDTDYEELNVHEGVEFKVRIEGRGWYLNRYDKEHLSFTRRFLEPSYTSFNLYAKKSGQSYLLFSYLDRDVYVMVNIDHTQLKEEQVPIEITPSGVIPPELENEQVPIEIAPSDVIPPEVHEEKVEFEGKPLVGEPKEVELKEEPKKESEIYYVDRENKIVPVPFKGEDEQYKKGVRLFKRGSYSEAEIMFVAYLESCENCKYGIEASIKLAETYLALGKKQEAGILYEKVINLKSDQYMKEALIKRGDIFYSDANLEAAVNFYQRALEHSNDDLKLSRRVADIHYELNNYKAALVEYEKLRESGQTDDEVLFRIATIFDSPAGPRDIQKAYNYYKLLIDEFSLSKHFQFAQKRIKFMEKNFFNYK